MVNLRICLEKVSLKLLHCYPEKLDMLDEHTPHSVGAYAAVSLNFLGQVEGQDDGHNRNKVEPKARIDKLAKLVDEIEELLWEVAIC